MNSKIYIAQAKHTVMLDNITHKIYSSILRQWKDYSPYGQYIIENEIINKINLLRLKRIISSCLVSLVDERL